MVKVGDMTPEEMQAMLDSASFGHLGCAREGRPYVVPMNYAYDAPDVYFFTTEGMKTEYIEQNPNVCFQVEEVQDPTRWRSVVVIGRAERLTLQDEMEHAMQLITRRNPTLTPAINATQIDAWGRSNTIALYRIRPDIVDGRQTVSES
jgi:uncharacterized protein